MSTATCVAWLASLVLNQVGANAPQLPQPRAVEASGVEDDGPLYPIKSPPLPPSLQWGIVVDSTARIEFRPVSPLEMAQILAEDAERALREKSMRYGFRREASVDPRFNGQWHLLPGVGALWVAELFIPEAIGARLHFADFTLKYGSQVFAYSLDHIDRLWGPYEGRGPGDLGEVWTPSIFGEVLRVEYFVPEPAPEANDVDVEPFDPSTLPTFVIDAFQHIYRDPVTEAVGPCHNDVTCYPAWASAAKAEAGIGTINSDALFCSGTMLATTSGDLTPYWLTANHCISSAATATNSEIYWLYQTATCNGAPPSIATVPQSPVCTRLSFSSTSDYSLLMVEGVLPSGLFWNGWSSGAVANATNCTGIHHPDGSYKRISFGTKIAGAAANFIRIDWYDAPTEPGSSGSGIFRDDTKQLVGQLYGGPSSCADESYDDYGAFATTYGSISSLLASGSDDGFEVNDTCATARTMTSGTYANLMVKKYASSGEDWYALSVAGGGTMTATLSFTHASGDIDMQLYNACGGSVVASSGGSTNSESITYTNPGGTATFYLRVYLYNDTRNQYTMTLGLPGGGPSNDNCGNASVVVNGGTYAGSTASATRDGSASCGSSSTAKDVWFKYTAPGSGTLRLDTCGSAYDTVLSVHSACPGTSSNQLSCNDDCGGAPCGGVNSCITRAVTAGVTYYIRVSGYNGASGNFTLHVTGP